MSRSPRYTRTTKPIRSWKYYLGWTIFWFFFFFPIAFYYGWKTWKTYKIEKATRDLATRQAAEADARRAQRQADDAARMEAARQRREEFRKRVSARVDLVLHGHYIETTYKNVPVRPSFDWSDQWDPDYPEAQMGDDVEVVLGNGGSVEVYTADRLIGYIVNDKGEMVRATLAHNGIVLATIAHASKRGIGLYLKMYKQVN